MKTIISSKTLHNAIAEALNYDDITVKVSPKKLKFGPVETDLFGNAYGPSESFPFKPARWCDVLTFLYGIPEQPIIIDFKEEKIEITALVVFNI